MVSNRSVHDSPRQTPEDAQERVETPEPTPTPALTIHLGSGPCDVIIQPPEES
jgi:hypothetical protein